MRSNRDLAPMAEVYANRALLALTPEAVFKNISASGSTGLQAVKQLATYRTAADDNKEIIVSQLAEWLSSEMMKKDDTLQIVAAHIYYDQKNYKEALKLVKDAGENLEKYTIYACLIYRHLPSTIMCQ